MSSEVSLMSRAVPIGLRTITVCALIIAIACRDDEPLQPGQKDPDSPPRILASNGSGPNGKYHYATATGGLPSGNGEARADAWTLSHAFNEDGTNTVLSAGDTVWLTGGHYVGTFTVRVP